MSARGIFFEEEHVRAAAARLIADGYTADVTRDRFAGEDDDEDHPWSLTTDAADIVLELLVDEYDGWFDEDEPPSTAPTALDLPRAPRR